MRFGRLIAYAVFADRQQQQQTNKPENHKLTAGREN